MRPNVVTFAVVGIVLAILVAINLVFLSEPRAAENEVTGDRSSYRATDYGTLAFFTLLSETGHDVKRFEEPYTRLAASGVKTLFVVVPAAANQPTEDEMTALDKWVLDGGALVVVDREIHLKSDFGEIDTGAP